MTFKRTLERTAKRRGTTLLMTLMYLTLFGSLTTSMVIFSTASLQLSNGEDKAMRSLAAAESGMAFLQMQLRLMPKPVTSYGTISNTLAQSLWSQNGGIAANLAAQLNGSSNLQGKTCTVSGSTITVPAIQVASTSVETAMFDLKVVQDSVSPTTLHLTSVGNCAGILKGITCDVLIAKQIKYAVYSNVAIQLGKNVVVEGDIVSTVTSFSKGPPVWMLSDFRALTNQSGLDSDLSAFRSYINSKDPTYSNRLDVRTPSVATAAAAAGFTDRNGDGFIDDYDLFLKHVDSNSNGKVTTTEFTDPATGQPYDSELFTLLDTLSPPLTSGGTTRAGYNDGVIDNSDGYAKVKGTVQVGVTQSAWDTWARDTSSSGGTADGVGFREQFQGPVVSPDPTVAPVQFGINPADTPSLLPSNFDTSSYASASGTNAGATSGSVASGSVSNVVLTSSMANGGTIVEGTPYGSTSIQATYQRPVFNNVTFTNVTIPKGLNARFNNCTFKGVTYVNMTTNITKSDGVTTTTDPNDGMAWSQRMNGNSTFSSTTTLTSSNSQGYSNGNNLHFDGCTFNGPVTAADPTAYTHFTNSWEFTGATDFNNTTDPTVTIMGPNTNIEMGSFSDPNAAPSTLLGVVVAGNIDIRGRSIIDGSVLVVGNGAGNTTLGYFGASDSSSNPTAQPEGGYGRLYMRYNPSRGLPNGINIPVTLSPVASTYHMISVYKWGG